MELTTKLMTHSTEVVISTKVGKWNETIVFVYHNDKEIKQEKQVDTFSLEESANLHNQIAEPFRALGYGEL